MICLVPWIWRWMAFVIWCCVPTFRGDLLPVPTGRKWDASSSKEKCISTRVDDVISQKATVTSLGTDTDVILPETNDGKKSSFYPINPVTPNEHCSGRTASLSSKRFILYIYSTNIGTEHFKLVYISSVFSLQNAVFFIILTCLVPVLLTFYIQVVLKLKK